MDVSIIVTVKLDNGPPDLAQAAQRLGVLVEDLDAAFGLLPVEIGSNEYAVRVKNEKLKLTRDGVQGPYADPTIEAV
jgi:hypothetical protein